MPEQLTKLAAAMLRLNITDQQLAELYRSGLSIARIAARCEVTPWLVWSRLTKLGVELRPRHVQAAPDLDPLRLRDLYERQELSAQRIAERLDLPIGFVAHQLRKQNIARRDLSAAAR